MESKVECYICHNKYKRITSDHLKVCHNISYDEYKIKFPNAILISEESKNKTSLSSKITSCGKNNGMYGKIPWNKGIPRTEEEKLKMSESKKKDNHLKGVPKSEEHRKKIGISNIGKHHTEETKQKIREKHLNKIISQETKNKISEIAQNNPNFGMKGKYHTEETKEKMRKPKSEEHKRKISQNRCGIPSPFKGIKRPDFCGKNNPSYGKPRNWNSKSVYYNSQLQGKVYLRSSYELAFAQYLGSNNIPWLYETQTFDLGNTTYTPDFYLPTCNMFIELKGYMADNAQNKINKFLDIYHEETLLILYKEDLIKLGVLK